MFGRTLLNYCPETHLQEVQRNLLGTFLKHSSPASSGTAKSKTWNDFVPCVHHGQSNLPKRNQVCHLLGKGCLHPRAQDQAIPRKLSSSPWRLGHLKITGKNPVKKSRNLQQILKKICEFPRRLVLSSYFWDCTVSKHPPDASEHQRCPCYVNWKDLKSLYICPITFCMYTKIKLWMQTPYTPSLHRKSVNSSRSCRYVGQPVVRIHQRERIAYLSLSAGLAILPHLNSFQWFHVINWWFEIDLSVLWSFTITSIKVIRVTKIGPLFFLSRC